MQEGKVNGRQPADAEHWTRQTKSGYSYCGSTSPTQQESVGYESGLESDSDPIEHIPALLPNMNVSTCIETLQSTPELN